MKKAIIGIDIGGTSTKFGAIGPSNELIFIDSVPTRGYNSLEEYLDKLFDSIKSKLKGSGLRIGGIGIGAPKCNQQTGYIEEAYNLMNWGDNVPITKLMSERFKAPAFLLNDGDAAAYGEKYFGAGAPYDNFILLTLGTGLGAGIYVNGELLSGAHGAASEVGHVIVEPEGRLCICGRHGCLETYASATGIVRTMRDILVWKEGEAVDLDIYESCDGISRAAYQGDELAQKAFEFTGKKLGAAMANLAAIFDPQAIILSGGVAQAGDVLLDPVKRVFEESLMDIYKGRIDIKLSEAQTRNLAVLGAASFTLRQLGKSPVNAPLAMQA